MRKLIVIFVVLLILAGAVGLASLLSSQKTEPPKKPAEEIIRAVKVDTVNYADILSVVESTGRLGSMHYVDVITEVSGEILPGNVSLKKGQDFKKDELLFRVFDKETQYTLKAAKSRFLNLIANTLPDLKIDFSENYDAWEKFFNAIEINKSLPKLPEFKSQQEKTFIASKNILTEYYTILSSEVRLSKYEIYAPFNGVFTEVYLEVGSVANMGSRIARIIRTDKLELEVPVDVEDIKWISEGDNVDVYSEDGNEQWKGSISRISSFVDPQTQSASVFIELKKSNEYPLYEGQYLRAVFTGRTIESVMEMPRNAVFNSNEVYIVRDNQLYKETINVHKMGEETLVFSGLEDGSLLVIEPLINIPERTQVSILGN